MSLDTPLAPARPRLTSLTTESSKIETKDQVSNKRLLEISIFIYSLWLNPTTNFTNESIIVCPSTRPQDYQHFLREVLVRSRCSMPVLQFALYHLLRLRDAIRNRWLDKYLSKAFLNCPKKTFLVCLILSFKFNYDANCSLKMWSKISGLQVKELKALEFNGLNLLKYDLNISQENFANWTTTLEHRLEKIAKQQEMPSEKRLFAFKLSETSMKRRRLCS